MRNPVVMGGLLRTNQSTEQVMVDLHRVNQSTCKEPGHQQLERRSKIGRHHKPAETMAKQTFR